MGPCLCRVDLDKKATSASWEGLPQRAGHKLVSNHHLEEGSALKAHGSRVGTMPESEVCVHVPNPLPSLCPSFDLSAGLRFPIL